MNEDDKRRLLLTRKKAILQARDQLIPFARYMAPDPDLRADATRSAYEVARHHRVIAAALEEVEAGRIKRLIISCPPRHGKTRLASMLFPAWYLGRNPQKSVVFATYNDKYAVDVGGVVKALLQSPLYAHVFPELKLDYGGASADRLRIAGGGDMFCVGVGGTLTGRGGDINLLDDPIKNRQEADSLIVRDKLWSWYQNVFRTRMMTQEARLVLIATRWSEDDLIGRHIDPANPHYNEEEARTWKIINLPALAEEDDPLGRAIDQPLWPERFAEPFLADQRRSDPRGFTALYQGRPTPAEGSFFKSGFLRTYNKMSDMPPPEAMRFYGASDFAVATRQENDKSCHMVIGVDVDDNIWVMPDIVWSRLPADMSINAVIHLMAKYKPMFWWGERGTISKSIGPFLRKQMQEKRVYCSIDEITPVADKLARAQSINARMSMGRVWFPGFTRWWADAREQLLKFPHSGQDDLVDALSLVGLGLMKQIPAKGKPKPKAIEPGVFTLGWVKAQTKRAEREARLASGW
jgi:predicted phage terminase large subunit-like protein